MLTKDINPYKGFPSGPYLIKIGHVYLIMEKYLPKQIC